jgi:hypothetical protein
MCDHTRSRRTAARHTALTSSMLASTIRSAGPTSLALLLTFARMSAAAGSQSSAPRHTDGLVIAPCGSAGLINFQGALFFSNPNNIKRRIRMTLKRSE